MARVRELAKQRDETLKAEYAKLKNQRKYTNEYIFKEILSPKFFLSSHTIERIVYSN